MTVYYRPILNSVGARPNDAKVLAGGWCWFTEVDVIERNTAPRRVHANELSKDVLKRLTDQRTDIAGLSMERPQVMGILNVTPDSFSDGGAHNEASDAVARARQMAEEGASLIDIGGESTRPGAEFVSVDEEIRRVVAPISALRQDSDIPISIDTRKSEVAQAALDAGATLVNDVAAFTFDPGLAKVTAQSGAPVCLMHAQGDPKTMQDDPVYDDVLLDVYDFLEARIAVAEAAGISRNQIIVDPGIGFGKTVAHNLELLHGLAVFHSLGCPILLGASRKRFIGTIGNAPDPQDRIGGSVSVGLFAVNQGVQFLRVHDTYHTKQAIDLHMAMIEARADGT